MNKCITLILSVAISLLAFDLESFADTPILKPGETYVVRQYRSKGDLYNISGPEYHSFEITTYQDGTASGVYLVGLDYYDEKIGFRVNMTGRWSYVSRYDKKVVKISLVCNDANRRYYTIYVDDNLNAFIDDLNNQPETLRLKSELENEDLEIKKQKREEREKAELLEKVKQHTVQYYDLIDLGLSVKWSNATFNTMYADAFPYNRLLDEEYCTLRSYGHITLREIPLDFKETEVYKRGADGTVVLAKESRDILEDYVAGGKNHGEPCLLFGRNDSYKLGEALRENPRYNNVRWFSELQAYSKIEHVPTKAEWQELMDNCTINRSQSIYYSINEALSLTSKKNGNSIVLPYNPNGGTYYATCQFLSSDPNMATCVHVDASGLSFVEIERGRKVAMRAVYGPINRSEIDLQKARESAGELSKRKAAYRQEQEKLRQEYEKQLLDKILTIGVPNIFVDNKTGNDGMPEWKVTIKAPVISGNLTDSSWVKCYVLDRYNNKSRERTFNAMIKTGKDRIPSYIELEPILISYTESVFIRFDSGCGVQSLNANTSDGNWQGKSLNDVHYYSRGDSRIISGKGIYFKINDDYSINYVNCYDYTPPVPEVNAPVILNMGAQKENEYKNVEVGFTAKEIDLPYEHSQLQTIDLIIQGPDKEKIKVKYLETTENVRKYSVAKLTAGVPYIFTASAKDQFGHEYKQTNTITLNTDGTILTLKEEPLIESQDHFQKWVNEHIRYPEEAVKQGLEGPVIVNFEVTVKGEVINARIFYGKHELLNKEALRVVNSSPKWVRHRWNTQTDEMTISVDFKL